MAFDRRLYEMIAFFFALALLLAPSSADAGMGTSRDSNYNVAIPAAPSYTGPGDIVPGATFWHGLRAYNATYATGSNNALNVRRASDNATANIVILSNGNLDVATAATFAGTDATCTSGSASNSTTLALTGCSSTPTKGDSVLGTVATGSLVQPAYIESVGSFTGGAGNVVLNVKQTVTLSSVTLQVGLYVTELYDQTGNGYSPTQSTAAQQPKLQLSCLNNLPCIVDDPGLGYGYLFLTSPTLTSSQPISLSTMALEKVVQASAFLAPYNYPLGSGIAFDSTAPALVSSNGSTSTYLDSGTATVANTWYLLEAVLTTSPNAVIAVNGVSTTGNAGSGTWSTAALNVLASNGDYQTLDGFWTEGGAWAGVAFSSTQITNLCHNQYTYWGTSTSC